MTLAFVQIPIRMDVERNKDLDDLAMKTMQALSSTPVTDFKFVRRELSWKPNTDLLHYEGQGTPK